MSADSLKAIKKKLDRLNKRHALILAELEEAKANLEFPCGCGTLHKIKDCDVIQTHWYTPPRGCTDGDYWSEGELQIVCPVTGDRNRVLSDKHLEDQFKYQYRGLFKSVIDTDWENAPGGQWNNYFLNENVEYYGLKNEKTS